MSKRVRMEDEKDNEQSQEGDQENLPSSNVLDNIEDSTGVLYIHQIPRNMCVQKLRHYMSQFGEVGRIYVQKQKKRGTPCDAWVEYLKKKVAKKVAFSLNAKPVGGPKRHNPWRDDLWNIKYLSGFKWHHLSEHSIFKKMVRKERHTAEIAQLKRVNDFYLSQVMKAKRLEKKQKKK